MKFGEIPIEEAEGCILAHTVRLAGGVLKKGVSLGPIEIEKLRKGRCATVIAARLEPGDVPENDAAARVAWMIAGANIRAADASMGRVNLFSEQDGLFVADAPKVEDLNRVHEAITVATLTPFTRVSGGQMVATIKIIPFAVPGDRLAVLEDLGRVGTPDLAVAPFRTRRVGLILSRCAGDRANVVQKRRNVIEARVESLGGVLVNTRECSHDIEAVSDAIGKTAALDCDLILVFGAAAIADRGDVIPAALEKCGGEIVHLGMPVDPGNLLLLGELAGNAVVGVPSCASSPKMNGFDWVLERLFTDLPMGPDEIVAMAPGGLLAGL